MLYKQIVGLLTLYTNIIQIKTERLNRAWILIESSSAPEGKSHVQLLCLAHAHLGALPGNTDLPEQRHQVHTVWQPFGWWDCIQGASEDAHILVPILT